MAGRRQMKFSLAANLRERFTTVRVGQKWGDTTPGEELELMHDDEVVGVAKVFDKWQGQIGQVPALLLEMEHSPLARTFSGLLVSMQIQYGEKVNPGTVITVLVLDPVENAIEIAGMDAAGRIIAS